MCFLRQCFFGTFLFNEGDEILRIELQIFDWIWVLLLEVPSAEERCKGCWWGRKLWISSHSRWNLHRVFNKTSVMRQETIWSYGLWGYFPIQNSGVILQLTSSGCDVFVKLGFFNPISFLLMTCTMTSGWIIQVPLGAVAEGETKEATIFYAATWSSGRRKQIQWFRVGLWLGEWSLFFASKQKKIM